jgi:hypothetical protein
MGSRSVAVRDPPPKQAPAYGFLAVFSVASGSAGYQLAPDVGSTPTSQTSLACRGRPCGRTLGAVVDSELSTDLRSVGTPSLIPSHIRHSVASGVTHPRSRRPPWPTCPPLFPGSPRAAAGGAGDALTHPDSDQNREPGLPCLEEVHTSCPDDLFGTDRLNAAHLTYEHTAEASVRLAGFWMV